MICRHVNKTLFTTLGNNLGLGRRPGMDCHKLCVQNSMYAKMTNLTNVIVVVA